jgi:predicted nucleotidyltransferase
MKKEEAIVEITRRVVEYFHPERVYLFGSAARGDMGPDSDLDFCIVLPDDAPKELYKARAREAIRGVGIAVDLIRLSARDFDRRAKYVAASLPASVLREGRLLYDAR